MLYYYRNVEIVFLSPKLAAACRIHTEKGKDCLISFVPMIVLFLILLNQGLFKGRSLPLDYILPRNKFPIFKARKEHFPFFQGKIYTKVFQREIRNTIQCLGRIQKFSSGLRQQN